MLSEEEILRLRSEANDEVDPPGWDLDCEFSWTEVLVFAHKIEAKVMSEYEPKFKVGDRVRSIYDKRKDAIITKIEQTRFYALKYEDDKYEPTLDYQDYEIEKIEEKL